MLRRPEAGPGCSWMRRASEAMTRTPPDQQAPARYRRWMIGFWIGWAVLMLAGNLVIRPAVNRAPLHRWESSIRIAGLPLVAVGEHPRGIVAVGGVPVGVIAIGGVAMGVVAFGGLAAGGLALGGLSVGVLAFGGGALGWWALGGGAVGIYAFGGLAIGRHAYAANGVALGYDEAHGRQKESLLG